MDGGLSKVNRSPVSGSGTRFGSIALSAPEDELLAAAARIRNEAMLLSLGLMLLFAPALVFVVARSTAKPLLLAKNLAEEAARSSPSSWPT